MKQCNEENKEESKEHWGKVESKRRVGEKGNRKKILKLNDIKKNEKIK